MKPKTSLVFDYFYDGIELALTSDPSHTDRCLPYQNYREIPEGEPYDFEMSATAADKNGATHRVYWIFTGVKGEDDPDLDTYDYSDIHNTVKI